MPVTFPAFASGFELFAKGAAADHFDSILDHLTSIEFALRIDDPNANQGQITSDFDSALGKALLMCGVANKEWRLPNEIRQEFDFVFAYQDKVVVVEVEKANREKILRDILKAHMYLSHGADFVLIVLPKNYPHKGGMWNLFEFGRDRLEECWKCGFGQPEKLGRIALLGFEQFDAETGQLLSPEVRVSMQEKAKSVQSRL